MFEFLQRSTGIIAAVVGSTLTLSACQSIQPCINGNLSCFPSTQKKALQPNLNPQFNFIRFSLNGNIAWLAQGSQDNFPKPVTEVYFSNDGSVSKWANGRLIYLKTPLIRWSENQSDHIQWTSFLQDSTQNTTFTRQIDTAENIFSVNEQRKLSKINEPKRHNYVGNTKNLIWLHETTITSHTNKAIKSYDSWYAILRTTGQPVYGQQCISKQQCISWQKWNK